MQILSLILSITLFSATSYAGLNMKPGLWQVTANITQDGKDLMAEQKKAIAQMPEAQRKQVEAMMKSSGGEMPGASLKVCYSKEMIDSDNVISQVQERCETKITAKTANKVAGTFDCKDGSKGDIDWSLSDSSNYKGNVNVENHGKKTKILSSGKFLSADCGTVKPIDIKALTGSKKK